MASHLSSSVATARPDRRAPGGEGTRGREQPTRPGEDTEEEGRRATWLELFYDLVYVLAISRLSNGLYSDLSVHGALVFVALFVPVWWAWVGLTFYETRYQCDSDLHRVLILLAMLASTVMALSLRTAFTGQTAAFALGYAGVRAVLVLLYEMARRTRDGEHEVADRFVRAFGVGALLWAASALVPSPWRYALWALGLVFDVGAPLIARGALSRSTVDGNHMPERFGLFVLIVLGESVVGVGAAVNSVHWDAGSVLIGVAGFVIVASVWWTYFDLAAEGLRRMLTRSGSSGKLARDAYAYWHFPLVAGLVVLSVGIELAILRAGAVHAAAAVRWTLAGGIAAYLLAVSGVHLTSSRRLAQVTPYTRAATAGLLLVLAGVGGGLSPVAFVLPAAALTAGSLAFETHFVRSRSAGHREAFAAPEPPA